jgi:hypothetical protein
MRNLTLHRAANDAPQQREPRRGGMKAATRRFVRHYAEMVVAMFLGMAVLGVPAGWALGAVGSSWSELNTDAPSLMLLGMAVTMTVPMVGWMRYRGHGWRANTEMSASMVLPTFAAIGVLHGGVIDDVGTVLVIEHVAMLLGMLVAMLLRPDEYTHHHGHAHAQLQPRPATA